MFCSQCGKKNSDDAKFCINCGHQVKADGLVVNDDPEFLSATVNDSSFELTHPAKDHVLDASVPQRYAGFWIRTIAAIIDGILVQIAAFITSFAIGFLLMGSLSNFMYKDNLVESLVVMASVILGFIVPWLWFVVPESSSWQASLGKKILGLRVVDIHGQRISFGRANARYWSKILSALFLMIGFFMIGFTPKKQGMHDKIAKTYVLRK